MCSRSCARKSGRQGSRLQVPPVEEKQEQVISVEDEWRLHFPISCMLVFTLQIDDIYT